MKLKTITLAAAASLLAAAPVLAQTDVVSRAPAQVEDAEEAIGNGALIGILALAAATAVIIIADDDDDEDEPVSP